MVRPAPIMTKIAAAEAVAKQAIGSFTLTADMQEELIADARKDRKKSVKKQSPYTQTTIIALDPNTAKPRTFYVITLEDEEMHKDNALVSWHVAPDGSYYIETANMKDFRAGNIVIIGPDGEAYIVTDAKKATFYVTSADGATMVPKAESREMQDITAEVMQKYGNGCTVINMTLWGGLVPFRVGDCFIIMGDSTYPIAGAMFRATYDIVSDCA